jgi:hypothetical protein
MKPNKFTLLRRHEDGDTIEAGDLAVERMATDAEIKAVWQDPARARWSYVIRDHNGCIAASGADDTQEACLRRALDSVT